LVGLGAYLALVTLVTFAFGRLIAASILSGVLFPAWFTLGLLLVGIHWLALSEESLETAAEVTFVISTLIGIGLGWRTERVVMEYEERL
jgi:hypothetical protein